MDRAKWIEVGLQITEPLKELQNIATKNGLDCLSIAVFGDKNYSSYATFIDGNSFDENAVHYEVRVQNGKASLSADQDTYYIQT